MYKGMEQFSELRYVDRWTPGIGTHGHCIGSVPVIKHVYRCDHCGRKYAFIEAAAEPFYCHSPQCQGVQVVSITSPGTGRDETPP
jgi:hypothetical protein